MSSFELRRTGCFELAGLHKARLLLSKAASVATSAAEAVPPPLGILITSLKYLSQREREREKPEAKPHLLDPVSLCFLGCSVVTCTPALCVHLEQQDLLVLSHIRSRLVPAVRCKVIRRCSGDVWLVRLVARLRVLRFARSVITECWLVRLWM